MRPDTDRPVLALMAELDHEELIPQCVRRLESIKQRGGPVQWRVFAKTTRARDKAENSGTFTKMPWMSDGGRYAYDEAVTNESRDRAFKFLKEAFSR